LVLKSGSLREGGAICSSRRSVNHNGIIICSHDLASKALVRRVNGEIKIKGRTRKVEEGYEPWKKWF